MEQKELQITCRKLQEFIKCSFCRMKSKNPSSFKCWQIVGFSLQIVHYVILEEIKEETTKKPAYLPQQKTQSKYHRDDHTYL